MAFALQFGGFDFRTLFYDLQNMGVFDVLIPFILIFTIIYAILQKVHIFGAAATATTPDTGKKYNLVIALVISLIAIVPHITGTYPQNFDIVNMMNSALPQIALVLIGVLLLMIFMGFVGGKQELGSGFMTLIALIGVLAIVLIFARALYPESTPWWLSFLDNPSLQMFIVVAVVFGLIVWFVTKEPRATGGEKFLESVGKFFKGS